MIESREKIYETPIQLGEDARDALNDKIAVKVETAGMLGVMPNGEQTIAMLCMFDHADGTKSQVVLNYGQMTELCEVIIRCIDLAPIPK